MNMQVINSKAPGGFRPLTADEIMAVSGGNEDIVVYGHREGGDGDIVVTGVRPQPTLSLSLFISDGGSYDNPLVDLFAGFGGGGSVGDFSLIPIDGSADEFGSSTFEDTDGDGEPDTIVVTAPEDRLPLLLAQELAADAVVADLALYGAIFGAFGADLATLLRFLGVTEGIAGGIVGAAEGVGVVTSLSGLLPELQDALYSVYVDRAFNHIQLNPEQYQNYILLNGQPFDANRLDD